MANTANNFPETGYQTHNTPSITLYGYIRIGWSSETPENKLDQDQAYIEHNEERRIMQSEHSPYHECVKYHESTKATQVTKAASDAYYLSRMLLH